MLLEIGQVDQVYFSLIPRSQMLSHASQHGWNIKFCLLTNRWNSYIGSFGMEICKRERNTKKKRTRRGSLVPEGWLGEGVVGATVRSWGNSRYLRLLMVSAMHYCRGDSAHLRLSSTVRPKALWKKGKSRY